MVDSAWTSAAEADMIALMFDLPQFKARKMEIDKLHEEIKSRITAIQKKRSRGRNISSYPLVAHLKSNI